MTDISISELNPHDKPAFCAAFAFYLPDLLPLGERLPGLCLIKDELFSFSRSGPLSKASPHLQDRHDAFCKLTSAGHILLARDKKDIVGFMALAATTAGQLGINENPLQQVAFIASLKIPERDDDKQIGQSLLIESLSFLCDRKISRLAFFNVGRHRVVLSTFFGTLPMGFNHIDHNKDLGPLIYAGLNAVEVALQTNDHPRHPLGTDPALNASFRFIM